MAKKRERELRLSVLQDWQRLEKKARRRLAKRAVRAGEAAPKAKRRCCEKNLVSMCKRCPRRDLVLELAA